MATEAREATEVEVVDLATTPLRELNQRLHDVAREGGPTHWRIVNPNGGHAAHRHQVLGMLDPGRTVFCREVENPDPARDLSYVDLEVYRQTAHSRIPPARMTFRQ